MQTTVTVKGQVTIPKRIREIQGLLPGSKVMFDVNEAGETVIRPAGEVAARRPDRFDEAIGSADIKLGCSTDEFMEWLRGYSDDPA
jgi:AbrB family looped-hinge helix DNA binding protein